MFVFCLVLFSVNVVDLFKLNEIFFQMSNLKPVLLLFPKSLLKSFDNVNELPLSYRHLTKGRQFSLGEQKVRARREKSSTAEFFCLKKQNDDKNIEIVSSNVETFSLVQDIDPPNECQPKEVTFRPDFPSKLKLRCLPFGSVEPKVFSTKSKSKKKRKRLDD